jgi:uncharacterized membrane protein
MLNAYTIYKSIHVLAAVIWVGSDVALHVIGVRAKKAGPQFAGWFAKQVAFYGKFILTGSALVLIVFGFLTLDQIHGKVGDLWVSLALAVWVASFVVGVFYLGPTTDKLGKAIDEAGGELPPEQTALFDRILLINRIEILLLLAIVVDMVVKPT